MELVFNELSVDLLSPTRLDADKKMEAFSKTIASLQKNGFKNIRSPSYVSEVLLTNDYSLHDWLQNKNISEILRNNLYGVIIYPFIKDEDEEVGDKFIEADFYFEDAQNGIAKTECLGLAAAHLYDTAAISLPSSPAWKKNNLDITIETNGNITAESVLNIYSEGCLVTPPIDNFIEHAFDLELVETVILPKDKGVHISRHHGIAELTALSKRMRNNPYVIEMWSTEWGGNKFIRKVSKDGLIEITLVDTQRKYAFLVQTTGRNYRETLEISEILQDKYS